MAFYKDVQHKSRQEKRVEASHRGGFEDEGKRYREHDEFGRGKSNGKKSGGLETARFGSQPNAQGQNKGDRKPLRYGKFSDMRTNQQINKAASRKKHNQPPRTNNRSIEGYDSKPGYRKQVTEQEIITGKVHSHSAQRSNSDTHHNHERSPRTQFNQVPPKQHGYESFRFDEPIKDIPRFEHFDENVSSENLLCGRNPIREALKNGRDIEKLMVAKGDLSGSAREILAMARERHVLIQEVDRVRLDMIAKNHQGMVAFASAYSYSSVEKMLEISKEKGEAPFLVILDGITDPHNLGAIIRSAECAGAHGVIVQERRAVGLTPAAVKASAGAIEYMPVARVTNLVSTIELLKRQNIWIYAADMNGQDYSNCDFSGGVALVIGAEGEGISRRVLDNCDKTVSLPIKGHVDSLNASVAAGILMYAVMKSRL